MRHRAVSRRYQHPDRVNANTLRLRALVALFKLTASDIAKATGFSRCYVARLLSDRDDFQANSTFYRIMEQKIGTIIDQRTAQFFTIPATPVARARDVLKLAA